MSFKNLTYKEVWEEIKSFCILSDAFKIRVKEKDNYVYLDRPLRNDDEIQVSICLDNPGYLVMIQKTSSGQYFCLCPSVFTKDAFLLAGENIIPNTPNENRFLVTGEGVDETIAIIFKNPIDFDWLPKANQDDPIVMNMRQISNIWNAIKHRKAIAFLKETTILA